MSVINGQNADATTFNSAFASKSADNTLQGKQTLARPGSGATVVDTQQAINDVIASDALKIPTAEKGVANGVATLDVTTKVPVAQIPDLTASKITDFNTSADARITLQKGAPSGIAPLDGSSKIDSSYLPSYVDDVVEVANYASLPVTGETGKIYVTLDTNKTYRWSGSVYVQIGQPIASTSDVPEGTNLYFTPARVADKQIGIQFQDQGSNLGTTATVDTIDFIGAGIQATRASNKVTVEVTATGGGGGSKNYFSQSSINPDFETGSVSPWQVMTTTWSGNSPTNAPTPGAVVTTFYTNIVSPLAGTTSAMMTKGLGVGQYEGVMSGVFTIDREDLAKVLYGSFAYEVSGTASANFDVSGTSSQTLEIWVYNVNANQWIQPAGFRGINQFTGPGQVTFSFQTDSTPANNQYRICLIIRQNTGGTWNLKVDDFKVGPQAIVLGSAMTDWQTYTPTFTGLGSPTAVGFAWRRVGDSIEVQGKFTVGTSTATEARIGLPSGLTVSDTTKIPSLSKVGSFSVSYIEAFSGEVLTEPSVSYLTLGKQGGGTPGLQKLNGNSVFSSSGQVCSLFARIPIQGFSSFSQMSSDTDTRVVAFNATGTVPATTSGNPLIYPTVLFDTAGSYNSTTGKYTIPVNGIYKIRSTTASNPSLYTAVNVYKNNAIMSPASGSSDANGYIDGSFLFQFNAGDIIDVRPSGNTNAVSSAKSSLSIERLSGPSVVTATETVTASYWASANGTSSTTAPFNFDAKEYDTHNSVTTGASWKFTAPVSGVYSVSFYTNQNSPGNAVYYKLYKNSTTTSYKTLGYCPATVGLVTASTSLRLNAGDYIGVYSHISQNYLGNASLNSDLVSHISINRIGN